MPTEFDIGFLGGGQLARMSIQAAQRMGLRCLSLDPGADTPASQIAPALQGALDDVQALAQVFRRCARVTLENEFIPAAAIEEAVAVSQVDSSAVLPGTATLAIIQDKFSQRRTYAAAGVPSPAAYEISPDGQLKIEGELIQTRDIEHLFPLVLKARFGGYDGKGTRYAKSVDEFLALQSDWGKGNWHAEEFVAFKRELAVMVYRSPGHTGCFPVVETVQANHVCDLVFPATVNQSAFREDRAREVAIAAVESVRGFGLFGVELFETADGAILVNEMAPRPHNTGHYTLDWGGVSQFEQHVRLVMGWPLASPKGAPTCMANLLGQEGAGDHRRAVAAALEDDTVRVHWYGKTESRPGRKMGHINAVGEDCVERAVAARERFYAAWTAIT